MFAVQNIRDAGHLLFYIYHMERIEDICANVLIADDRQVILESPWLQRRE